MTHPLSNDSFDRLTQSIVKATDHKRRIQKRYERVYRQALKKRDIKLCWYSLMVLEWIDSFELDVYGVNPPEEILKDLKQLNAKLLKQFSKQEEYTIEEYEGKRFKISKIDQSDDLWLIKDFNTKEEIIFSWDGTELSFF